MGEIGELFFSLNTLNKNYFSNAIFQKENTMRTKGRNFSSEPFK